MTGDHGVQSAQITKGIPHNAATIEVICRVRHCRLSRDL
jgi:hypothetical protein